MDETKILETFRLDFTFLQRDIEALCKLFDKYGYPNLDISTKDSYDGFWQVFNKRNNEVIWSGYHSGFVTFFEDGGLIKIAFDYKGGNKVPSLNDYKTFVYFENVQSVTNEMETIEKLKEHITQLKSNISQLELELKTTKNDFENYKKETSKLILASKKVS